MHLTALLYYCCTLLYIKKMLLQQGGRGVDAPTCMPGTVATANLTFSEIRKWDYYYRRSTVYEMLQVPFLHALAAYRT